MTVDWVRLELDPVTFDHDRFAPAVDRVRSTGISLTTLADLGDTDDNRHRLYELNKTCSADIPNRGEFHTWDEYRRVRLDVAWFTAAGAVLALDGDEWVGMSVISDHAERGFAFQEMTGVVRSHRRRGLALAMKAVGIGFPTSLGVRQIRTIMHPDNHPIIGLNRLIGYVDAGDWN